jgi:hypothetical protein
MRKLLLTTMVFFGSLGGSYALPECTETYNKTTWTNCVGSMVLPEGSTPVNTGDHYKGVWINGKPEGHGVLTSNKIGDFSYIGEFKNGGAHGIGTFTTDEYQYVGEWKDDKRNGQGTLTFSPPSKLAGGEYVGEFKDDQFNGEGTFTFASGQITEGIFKDDNFLYAQKVTPNIIVKKPPPLGSLGVSSALPDCPVEINRTKSPWSNCLGTYTYNNGGQYVGEWKDNHRSGQGVMTYPYGQEYIGEWKSDKKHGQGALIYSGGRLEEGVWKDDKFLYAPKRKPLVIKK